MADLIDGFGTNEHYPLAIFRNSISKNIRPSYKGMVNNGTPLSSSDSESEFKMKKSLVKICHATFDKTNEDQLFISYNGWWWPV